MASDKVKLRRATIFSAIITLIGFGYKLGLGIMTMSLVLMIASLSALLLFICKVLFIKNVIGSRASKKKAYLFMTISLFIFITLFILFSVLKVNGIDTSNNKTYEGIWGSLFIAFILVMFILSILGLKGALDKTDLMVIGLKEMTFVSALTDLVIIEEFVSRIILEYQEITYMPLINSYFALGVSALMVVVLIIMFVRYLRYKA